MGKTRIRMVRDICSVAQLPPHSESIAAKPPPIGVVRLLKRTDDRKLGQLIYQAILGTVDDKGESPEEVEDEIRRTLSGCYGPIIWEASFVAMEQERLIGACVITDYKGLRPLLAFCAIRPDLQRHGVATDLMLRSILALRSAGYERLCLEVTEANTPAVKLYKKLGFKMLLTERETKCADLIGLLPK